MKKLYSNKWQILIFLLPALILFCGVLIAPIAMSTYYSFFKWNGIGEKTFIQFSNIARWADSLENSYVVINEAKLILPATSLLVDSVYKAPSMLSLIGFNADSTTYLLPDYYEGTNYFGGSYNTSQNTVTFRVSEYMQDIILKHKDNAGLSLGINGAAYNAQRLVLNGPEAAEGEKMRLEVTYSIVSE